MLNSVAHALISKLHPVWKQESKFLSVSLSQYSHLCKSNLKLNAENNIAVKEHEDTIVVPSQKNN